MGVDFFTPVDYLNKDNGYFGWLQPLADDYFNFGQSKNRAYVLDVKNNSYYVHLIPCETNVWMTALKIASLPTLIIPFTMLVVKLVNRAGKEFIPQFSGRTRDFEIITPKRRESDDKRSDYEDKYRKIFRNAGLEYAQATSLQKHVAFFADENGGITRQSMQEGFERLHLGKIKSFLLSWVVFNGLISSTGSTNGKICLKDIAKGKHASDTGAFTADGEFDSTKYENLRRFAKTNSNLLTAEELSAMRSAQWTRDQNLSGATTGALASKGEFDLLLTLFGDRYVVDREGNATAAISLDRLQEMYTKGPLLFEEVAAQ